MTRRLKSLLIVLLLLTSSAGAESWNGSVVYTQEAAILASADGTLESLNLTIGQEITSGTVVGQTAVTPVFASQSGTVSLVHFEDGDSISGTVLEITPVAKYRIVSSTKNAYSSSETSLVHGGETLYIRCTADGSHVAIGFTANLSESSFDVFTTAGELYIGETVNLYRSPDYAYESKVGVGTVVESDLDAYSAEGYLVSMKVQEGSYVERGQLLFTYSSSESTAITVPSDGIVTGISAAIGDHVQQDQSLASMAVLDSIRIQFSVPENMLYLLSPGDTMYYLRADDPKDTRRKATISGISHTAEGDTYSVYLVPEEKDLPIGLSVTVVNDALH